MILEERRKTSLGKMTGVLSVLMGGDLLMILIFSQSALTGLQALAKGVVPNSAFLLLIVLGGISAIIAGVSLLKYKHFQTITFSIGCGFAIFFGVTLALLRASEFSNVLLIGTNALIGAAILLAGVVMFLSIYPRKL
jgi:hypothetical protein